LVKLQYLRQICKISIFVLHYIRCFRHQDCPVPLATKTDYFIALTMLRRKPTALTITSEDIATFEEQHARAVAYLRYQKTGEDPNGYFSNNSATYGAGQRMEENVTGDVDPNDELKPLPGDKARIVRTREERIVGTGGGTGGRR
jgi:Anaphase-promoting complex APC subunit CDC26